MAESTAAGPGSPQSHAILKVIALVFLVSGALTLVTSRGRHLAWPIFFLIAALAATPLWTVAG